MFEKPCIHTYVSTPKRPDAGQSGRVRDKRDKGRSE